MRHIGNLPVCKLSSVSIHAPREGCDRDKLQYEGEDLVSIHAPREGCDHIGELLFTEVSAVSIHAPREGCDPRGVGRSKVASGFQFTHPGRGATLSPARYAWLWFCFNSRTPGGVRQIDRDDESEHENVSIHAPREGCDSNETIPRVGHWGFNSRTPGGVRPERRVVPRA